MSSKNNELRFPPSSFKKREEETFEDYTSVTPWEKFVQSLENILSRWELKADGDEKIRQSLQTLVTSSLAGYICGSLYFGDAKFHLVYYSGLKSSSPRDSRCNFPEALFVNTDAVFPGHMVPSIAWFGLRDVLILRLSEGSFVGGTRLHMLLSSVEMAMHAVRCPLPILIEYAAPYSSYFYGLATIPPCSTEPNTQEDLSLIGALNVDFSVGQLRDNVTPLCTHLTGLRGLFLEKLGYPSNTQVHIAARFIYPIPFWPQPEALQPSPPLFPSFTFDLTPVSSSFPQFYLATVWPNVPSHAITQKHSWTTLRPEGAPEWYLQASLQTSHADRLTSRLKRFCRTCRDSDALEFDDPLAASGTTALSSRISWLGADLPRLKDLLRGHPPPILQTPSNVDHAGFTLTEKHVIHYLLFLFPDADASSLCDATVMEEIELSMTNQDCRDGLLQWSRIENRNASEMLELARRLGLPPPNSMTHRLAVLLCNLHYIQSPVDHANPVQILYREMCLELRLRLERLICLPGHYENRGVRSTNLEEAFEQWSDRQKCDLEAIFTKFSTCIELARASSAVSETLEPTGDEDDAFFDAAEEIRSIDLDSDGTSNRIHSEKDAHFEEAQSILQWLQSLSCVQFLRLLMPGVCLETLITLHSLEPHDRIRPFYTKSLRGLVDQLDNLFSRFSEDRVSLHGYSDYKELHTATFCEALTVLASFTARLNFFKELLSAFLLHANPEISDASLSFLHAVAMNAVCGFTEWSAHHDAWIPIDRTSETFNEMEKLFGTRAETSGTSSSDTNPIQPFQFTSSLSSWFIRHPPQDLRQPTWETYLFRTECGQPNPLASRRGHQRMYVELHNKNRRSTYDGLLVAGAFSHDTQFF